MRSHAVGVPAQALVVLALASVHLASALPARRRCAVAWRWASERQPLPEHMHAADMLRTRRAIKTISEPGPPPRGRSALELGSLNQPSGAGPNHLSECVC